MTEDLDQIHELPPPDISPLIAGTLDEEERALPVDANGCYEKYGIKFHELAENHLELLRFWRSHPDIQRFMVDQQDITPGMQEAWFQKIINPRYLHLESYAILEFRGELVGLTQLRKIDYPNRHAEGGIIIFRPEHQSGLIPYRAALGGLDSNFLHRGLETVYGTIRKTNSRARRFVKSLGYEFGEHPDAELLTASVRADVYFREAKKYRAILNADEAKGYELG